MGVRRVRNGEAPAVAEFPRGVNSWQPLELRQWHACECQKFWKWNSWTSWELMGLSSARRPPLSLCRHGHPACVLGVVQLVVVVQARAPQEGVVVARGARAEDVVEARVRILSFAKEGIDEPHEDRLGLVAGSDPREVTLQAPAQLLPDLVNKPCREGVLEAFATGY